MIGKHRTHYPRGESGPRRNAPSSGAMLFLKCKIAILAPGAAGAIGGPVSDLAEVSGRLRRGRFWLCLRNHLFSIGSAASARPIYVGRHGARQSRAPSQIPDCAPMRASQICASKGRTEGPPSRAHTHCDKALGALERHDNQYGRSNLARKPISGRSSGLSHFHSPPVSAPLNILRVTSGGDQA